MSTALLGNKSPLVVFSLWVRLAAAFWLAPFGLAACGSSSPAGDATGDGIANDGGSEVGPPQFDVAPDSPPAQGRTDANADRFHIADRQVSSALDAGDLEAPSVEDAPALGTDVPTSTAQDTAPADGNTLDLGRNTLPEVAGQDAGRANSGTVLGIFNPTSVASAQALGARGALQLLCVRPLLEPRGSHAALGRLQDGGLRGNRYRQRLEPYKRR